MTDMERIEGIKVLSSLLATEGIDDSIKKIVEKKILQLVSAISG